jgi:hypothetical protein
VDPAVDEFFEAGGVMELGEEVGERHCFGVWPVWSDLSARQG